MSTKQRASEVLEICISLVFSGEETVDSALAKFPEYEDSLRSELEAALWLRKQRSVIAPPVAFVAASRQRLVQQIKAGDIAPVPEKKALFGWMPALAMFAAVFLFISGFIFYSGNRIVQASLPGESAYRLKLTVEDIRLSLASDEPEAAALYIEFADERAREIGALVELGRYEEVKPALVRYQEQISTARDLIVGISDDPERKAELAQNLATTVSLNNQTFRDVMVTAVDLPADVTTLFVGVVAFNDEMVTVMVVTLDELGRTWTPPPGVTLLATETLVPTATNTLFPTDTLVPTETSTLTETPTPTGTLDPSLTTTPASFSDATSTPAPPASDNDDGEIKPTKKPTKTPKPKKTPPGQEKKE